jgi:hypothetical protein
MRPYHHRLIIRCYTSSASSYASSASSYASSASSHASSASSYASSASSYASSASSYASSASSYASAASIQLRLLCIQLRLRCIHPATPPLHPATPPLHRATPPLHPATPPLHPTTLLCIQPRLRCIQLRLLCIQLRLRCIQLRLTFPLRLFLTICLFAPERDVSLCPPKKQTDGVSLPPSGGPHLVRHGGHGLPREAAIPAQPHLHRPPSGEAAAPAQPQLPSGALDNKLACYTRRRRILHRRCRERGRGLSADLRRRGHRLPGLPEEVVNCGHIRVVISDRLLTNG